VSLNDEQASVAVLGLVVKEEALVLVVEAEALVKEL
jgi:hypothetical protein